MSNATETTPTTVCRTADLKVGDRITEVDTPEGPFYDVLNVVLKGNRVAALVVETATPDELALGESYPLTLRIAPSSAVLVVDDSHEVGN